MEIEVKSTLKNKMHFLVENRAELSVSNVYNGPFVSFSFCEFINYLK